MNQNIGIVPVISNIVKNEVNKNIIFRESYIYIMDFLPTQAELLLGTL